MRRTASGEHTFVAVAFLSVLSALLYAVVIHAQQRIAFSAPSWPIVALYVAATFGLFGIYLTVVGLPAGRLAHDRHARITALVAPIVIQGALIWAPPTLSIDLFSYLAHGEQVQLGRNPYVEPVKETRHTAYGSALIDRGWRPVHGVSPYGPLWTWIESGVTRVGTSVGVHVRIAKAVVVIGSLAAAWLIWLILGSVAPRRQLDGTLLYLWNPVVIVEFGGDGHNDALAAAGVLLALLLTVSARPGSSLVALGSSALVKITSLAVLPPQAVLWWRQRGRSVLPLAVASVVLAAAAAILYAPFWNGPVTLDGMWGHGRPSVQPSTQGVIFWSLTRVVAPDAVGPVLSIAMAGIFAVFALAVSMRVTDELAALRACGVIAVGYLLLAPGYWPWYATLPIALLSLSPGGWWTATLILLSLGARLAAPVERLRLNGLMEWPTAVIVTTVVGLWLPAVALALAAMAKRHGLRPRAGGVVDPYPSRVGRGQRARRVAS
jgi:hypothetical protein